MLVFDLGNAHAQTNRNFRMNTDIRIAVSFKGHRKRRLLRMLLGPGSTDYLIDLWISTAMNHPSGILTGMKPRDIALEAGWEDEPDKFVNALLESGFVDITEDGVYVLHDWEDHQGYAIHAEMRTEKARKAALARWGSKDKNAPSMLGALPQAQTSNAPSPAPSPAPLALKTSLPPPENGRRLGELLFELVQKRDPKAKPPDMDRWARDMDRLFSGDNPRTPDEVEAVIRWAQEDPFWSGIILSPKRLRTRFTQIILKMGSNEPVSTGRAVSDAEFEESVKRSCSIKNNKLQTCKSVPP